MCHATMGNDFWFLPKDACLYKEHPDRCGGPFINPSYAAYMSRKRAVQQLFWAHSIARWSWA